MSEEKNENSDFVYINKQIKVVEDSTDEIMESTLLERPSWNTETCCLQALSNVSITPHEVIITADLPSIEPETVRIITIGQNVIKITGKMKKKLRFADLGIYHRQGEFTSLSVQDKVRVDYDSENMKISLKEGILEVRFPRKYR